MIFITINVTSVIFLYFFIIIRYPSLRFKDFELIFNRFTLNYWQFVRIRFESTENIKKSPATIKWTNNSIVSILY